VYGIDHGPLTASEVAVDLGETAEERAQHIQNEEAHIGISNIDEASQEVITSCWKKGWEKLHDRQEHRHLWDAVVHKVYENQNHRRPHLQY